MCYKPASISVDLLKSAIKHADNGNIEASERLIKDAEKTMRPVVNYRWTDGLRIGDWYVNARQALQRAKRAA